MMQEVTIKELSNEVKSKLRSGIAITSVTQCVEELVLNAIDGEATCIAVRVDLNIFRIQVVDNGNGITKEDLKFIGVRYATSKCHTLEDLNKNLSYFGFRGEALASLVQLGGVIEITSRHRSSEHTFSKLFTYGQDKSVIICDTNRPSIGTTVTIQDFMHNMPVRRKVMKESIDLENIRMRMECIALVHPMISLSIRNDANNKTIFITKKAKSSLDIFTQIFGTEYSASMAEIFHSFKKFTISGYMGTQPYHSKALQFVYVNKRYTTQTKIHSFLNELFNRTSIIRSKMQCIVPSAHADKVTQSPPKGIRYYGIFFLNIECSLSEYDICLDPKKTLVEFKEWLNLFVCIEELMLKFTKEEGISITLDDRFRKSEKETLDSYSESPMSHISSSLLQAFSNSKGNHTKDKANCIHNKITAKDEISIRNIKSAIHSFPANREKVNPVTNKEKELKDCCKLTTETNLDSEGKKVKTFTTDKNISELNKITNPIIDSNLLMKHTVPSSLLISETKTKTWVSDLEATNVSNRQKSSSISALKKLSTVMQSCGEQLAKSSNSKLTKDNCYHLSSIQELKCIYQKKLSENLSTPTNNFKPIISSPDLAKVELSRYDDTRDSIDMYYSKKGDVSKTMVSHKGLSSILSQKLIQKKKENLLQNTFNSFKFKKKHCEAGIFIKSKNKKGHVNVLDNLGEKSRCDSSFNFDPVSSSYIKNSEVSVLKSSNVKDIAINHNSNSNILSEAENFLVRKTGNKSNVISQFRLDNSNRSFDALNIEENHQIDEKFNNPTCLFREPDNGIDFETNNSTFLLPNDNVQNRVTRDIVVDSQNFIQKSAKATHRDDFTTLSEPCLLNKIGFNANNFNKNFEDIAFESTEESYLSNSLYMDKVMNKETVETFTVDDPCVVYDAARQNSSTDYGFVIPNKRCPVVNTFKQLSCQTSSTVLSDNSNLHPNIINENVRTDNDTSGIYLLSKEQEETHSFNKYNKVSINSDNFEEIVRTSDHFMNNQQDKFYLTNCFEIGLPATNSLNDSTPKYIPFIESISNCNKEGEGDSNTHSSSTISTKFMDIAIQSQSTDSDKNFDGEFVTAETSESITFVNNSACSKVDLPHFFVPTCTLNNKIDQLSELNNFNSSNTEIVLDANGNKKTEYLILNKFSDKNSHTNCHNSEDETSSSKMIIKDFIINNETNNFFPIKRKIKSNQYNCLKFPKLGTGIQCGNSSFHDQQQSSMKMGYCLNFNETGFSNSSKIDLTYNTRNENFSDQLPNQVKPTSEMPSSILSKEIETPEVIAQKSSLESSSMIDSNEVAELSNAKEAFNSIDKSVPLTNSKDDPTSCSNDLLGQETKNLTSLCSSTELPTTDCIDLNPGIGLTKTSVITESDFLIIGLRPSSVNESSELKPENCVEDFSSPYMEHALDSFLNEHIDLPYIYSNENSDNAHFKIGKLCDEWSVPKIAMNADILSSHCEDREQLSNIKSYNLIHPYKFRSEMLQGCKVIGQVDNKFIAITFTCNSMLAKNSGLSKHFNLMALVDQHAADERVQLEKVLALSYDENTLQLKRKQLTTPFEINFRPEEVRIMTAYRGAFKDLGLEFTMVNSEIVLFHSLPCCLVAQERSDKYTRRCQTACKVVEATVKEMCENIRLIGGTSDTLSSRPLPKPLQHIYNTIACRSAIKFGDELSLERCTKLIQMLSKCKLPFQCAHGRPSIIPVVDLNYLQAVSKEFEPKSRLNLKKLVPPSKF